jgi:hypothetical protein
METPAGAMETDAKATSLDSDAATTVLTLPAPLPHSGFPNLSRYNSPQDQVSEIFSHV